MIILDANVLLYAYDTESPQHLPSRQWLENAVAGPQKIGIPWLTLWAFVRISTNARLYLRPLRVAAAFEIVQTLLDHPNVLVVSPGPRHAAILERITVEYQASGTLLTDAVLVSLAVEHGGALASTDLGMARFKEVRWINPLARK